MDISVLYPPNHHSLSDDIINNFTQKPPNRQVIHKKIPVSKARRSTVRGTYSINHPPVLPKTGARRQRTKRTEVERKRLHRERCRINQARYREKQLKATRDLEEAILKLQREIKSLESQDQSTLRVSTSPTMWSVAVEYFRQFRYFLHSSGRNLSAALDLLYGVLAPDAIERSIAGAEALVDKWRLFSLFFEDVEVELTHLKVLTVNTLVASTIIQATITEATLQYVFPHAFCDGEGDAYSSLVGRLLGQRLVMRGSVRFDWDNAYNRVVAIDCSADMLTPLLRVLGDLQDISRVFNNALLSPDCRQL